MEILGVQLIYSDAAMIVFGAAALISIFSNFINHKVGNRKQMDAVRERMEKHQKAFLEAQKNNDQKQIKKLEAEQEVLMGEFKNNMTQTMKPMLFTMPVVLGVFWWLGATFGSMGPIIDMPFGIPFLTKTVAEAGVTNGMDWFAIYIITAISTSLFLELVVRKVIKGKKK